MACDLGHEQIVDFLLTYDKPRVLANPKDNFGETALMKATRHGNARIVEALLTALPEIKLDSRNNDNETVFDIAEDEHVLQLLEAARDGALPRAPAAAPRKRASSAHRPIGNAGREQPRTTALRQQRDLLTGEARAHRSPASVPHRGQPSDAALPTPQPRGKRERASRASPGGASPSPQDMTVKTYEARVRDSPLMRGVDEKLWKQVLNDVVDVELQGKWADICGLEGAKQILYESVVLPELAPEFFTGLKAPPKGVLLFGPPGNGKTLLAKALANERKSTFFNISASSLVSKWLGEGEKLVRALFSCARALAPTVIFLDECDAVLTARSAGEHEGTRRLKNEFLLQTDGVSSSAAAGAGGGRVLVVGATNRPQDLDEAVLRRFVKRVHIPLPDAASRMQIATQLLQNESNALKDDDWQVVVKETAGYSAADLKSLFSEMVMIPVRESLAMLAVGAGSEKVQQHLNKNVRPACLQDFYKTLAIIRPSVGPDQLEALECWNRKFGSALSL